jgi:hypothetical protein
LHFIDGNLVEGDPIKHVDKAKAMIVKPFGYLIVFTEDQRASQVVGKDGVSKFQKRVQDYLNLIVKNSDYTYPQLISIAICLAFHDADYLPWAQDVVYALYPTINITSIDKMVHKLSQKSAELDNNTLVQLWGLVKGCTSTATALTCFTEANKERDDELEKLIEEGESLVKSKKQMMECTTETKLTCGLGSRLDKVASNEGYKAGEEYTTPLMHPTCTQATCKKRGNTWICECCAVKYCSCYGHYVPAKKNDNKIVPEFMQCNACILRSDAPLPKGFSAHNFLNNILDARTHATSKHLPGDEKVRVVVRSRRKSDSTLTPGLLKRKKFKPFTDFKSSDDVKEWIKEPASDLTSFVGKNDLLTTIPLEVNKESVVKLFETAKGCTSDPRGVVRVIVDLMKLDIKKSRDRIEGLLADCFASDIPPETKDILKIIQTERPNVSGKDKCKETRYLKRKLEKFDLATNDSSCIADIISLANLGSPLRRPKFISAKEMEKLSMKKNAANAEKLESIKEELVLRRYQLMLLRSVQHSLGEEVKDDVKPPSAKPSSDIYKEVIHKEECYICMKDDVVKLVCPCPNGHKWCETCHTHLRTFHNGKYPCPYCRGPVE